MYTILHISVSLSLQHGQTKVEEPHQPWFILQLQKTAYLQEIKAGKQGECEHLNCCLSRA
jgi:hypothetical protein